MKSKWIFESFKEWRSYLWRALKHFGKGLVRMAFAIVFGVWSVIVYCWRSIVRFIGNYPQVALVAFLAIIGIVWALTFTQMRYRAVNAEDRCNKMQYELANLKSIHGYE